LGKRRKPMKDFINVNKIIYEIQTKKIRRVREKKTGKKRGKKLRKGMY